MNMRFVTEDGVEVGRCIGPIEIYSHALVAFPDDPALYECLRFRAAGDDQVVEVRTCASTTW